MTRLIRKAGQAVVALLVGAFACLFLMEAFAELFCIFMLVAMFVVMFVVSWFPETEGFAPWLGWAGVAIAIAGTLTIAGALTVGLTKLDGYWRWRRASPVESLISGKN
jgi:hypothetical protein